MKHIQLIDIRGEIVEEIDDDNEGTCELCMSSSYYELPTYIFQDGAEIIEVDGYHYWGEYETAVVDNVVNFAAFIAARGFTQSEIEELKQNGVNLLFELVDQYNAKKEAIAQ